jgi:hypothetical protein
VAPVASNGLKLRDSIVTMITGLIDRQRPKPRVCEVYSYNRFTRFAEVLLPGETVPGIQARFPIHLQPSASKMDDGVGNAVGNLVLVEGTTNNYRITQIIEGNAFSFESPIRAYDALAGGGVITWDDKYLKWTYNLTTFVGVDNLITAGTFQIGMPAVNDLVTCHGITGYTDVAVTASGIDMRPDGAMMSTALFWAPDITDVNTGDVGTFHLVGGLIPQFIPSHWIMIAVMNQTNDYLFMHTGHSLKPGQSVQYGDRPPYPQPVTVYSTADEGPGGAGTTYVPGSTPVGLVFTAPDSGSVWVKVSARFKQTTATNLGWVSYSIRSGSTIGSGTVFFAADDEFALIAGAGVVSSGPAHSGSTRIKLHTGLTPGLQYNVRIEFKSTAEASNTSGGAVIILAREISVDPVLI